MKKILLPLCAAFVLTACNDNASTNKKSNRDRYEVNNELPNSGTTLSAEEKEQKLTLLISESKRTMDSIDVAYKTIRHDSRSGNLSLDDREAVNEALLELNNAKDLIVLETQSAVIDGLKQKTASLQLAMDKMNAQSAKMMAIANTLTRISGVIEKTTNLLAAALTSGLIRPKLPVQNEAL